MGKVAADSTKSVPQNRSDATNNSAPPSKSEQNMARPIDTYCSRVKGATQLKKTNDGFILPSGEACVKIPNSVIEKNRKSWDCFVIGQFYADPPSQGTIPNIVNGIWSKQYRDIAVSKLEGNAFLFRIPNVSTRNRVITQVLWQIEGRTMFVAKWEPGVNPDKPELKSAPIWLELRKVPFQFFNEESLERIASLVGEPKFLHPSTANKTNLEVAKVFTIIDPRKPLPEAVNVQFESGDISRVLVSSPWMPPVCDHCKEIGHDIKRCSKLPKPCALCKSTGHVASRCPNNKPKESNGKGKKTRRGRSRSKSKPASKGVYTSPQLQQGTTPVYRPKEKSDEEEANQKVFEVGGTSNSTQEPENNKTVGRLSRTSSLACSEADQDSSDTASSDSEAASSDSEAEEGQIIEFLKGNNLRMRNRHSGKNQARGKAPPNL